MGSECGIPASKAGLKFAQDAGAVKSLVAEANAKVMAFTTNKLDPLFENNDLKASGTGIYQEVFDNIDYGDQTPKRLSRPCWTAWSLLATPSAKLTFLTAVRTGYSVSENLRASAARTTDALVFSVNGYQILNELLPVCDLLHCLLQIL